MESVIGAYSIIECRGGQGARERRKNMERNREITIASLYLHVSWSYSD